MSVAALALLAAPAAYADFGIIGFSGGVFDSAGGSYSQAAGHPDSATTSFELTAAGLFQPDGVVKDVDVDLPPGLIGNPAATPTRCTFAQLFRSGTAIAACPPSSQVGFARIRTPAGVNLSPIKASYYGLYSLVPPPGYPAAYGFAVSGTQPVFLLPTIRTGGDYGISIHTRDINQGIFSTGAVVTLWGVPTDPVHDADRGTVNDAGLSTDVDNAGYCVGSSDPACTNSAISPDQRPVPLFTNPADCSAGPLRTTLRVRSWEDPTIWHSAFFDVDTNGNPTAVTGCGDVSFDPEISVRPTSTMPDAPTGLDVVLSMPTDGLEDPDSLAQASLKRVRVVLPGGMSINPASAGGLQGCTDAQLGLRDAGRSSCPDGSKVGTVEVETPLLDERLEGGVYVRSQASGDPGSGEMFRIAIVIDSELRGVRVKLAGRVAADPDTGRLVTTFDDNPQIPFSKLTLRLKDGPRAPLANPPTCGPKTVTSELSSWSAVDPDDPAPDEVVTNSTGFVVDCPGQQDFGPSFEAGAVSPTGGAFSPFVARIDRRDRQQYLSGVSVDMPKGLVAKLRGVELCPDAVAGDGSPGVCPAGSRIGTATIGAGVGSSPFYLKGDVYLTGPYKGGPYGLSVAVDVKAGPFDLGVVKVRQAIYVDPVTAELSVVSDPLPRIVKGVPARLRSVNVDVDRPGFTINPTSCAVKQVAATISSTEGAVHRTGSRFQAADCASLAFSPKLAMRLTGKGRRTGAHPGLKAILTQPAGQANIAKASVTLPKSVVLDPRNSVDPKLVCDYDKGQAADCPASSVIGRATANTPLLNRPLTGNVYLVQGIRFGANGQRIRTLPTLLVKLRGEVALDLRSRTAVKSNRLVSVFDQVPDAPVSKFSLQINGGPKGILVITRTAKANINICNTKQTAAIQTNGHNGKQANYNTTIKTPCTKKKANKAKRKKN